MIATPFGSTCRSSLLFAQNRTVNVPVLLDEVARVFLSFALLVDHRSVGWLPGLQVRGRVGTQAVEAGGRLVDGEASARQRHPDGQ